MSAETGILPNIQRALWSVWSAYADHSAYTGWGGFLICFRGPGQLSESRSVWDFQPLLVNSTQNTPDAHVLILTSSEKMAAFGPPKDATILICGQEFDRREIKTALNHARASLCYSRLKDKITEVIYAIERAEHAELVASPGYRAPILSPDCDCY